VVQRRIVFHTGGPAFHPVDQQAAQIAGWLGDGYECQVADGLAAFDLLDGCDLFVVMGLHWTGMGEAWAGSLPYYPLTAKQQGAFERYVASGRPLIAHHGAIASYDDWPRFGELLGFTWVWGVTTHSPLGEHTVEVLPTGHPIVAGVEAYTLFDELYYDVKVTPGLAMSVHAEATWDGQPRPMIVTASGGRVAGAGRTVYLANGHDLRAFACPALAQIWRNAVRWALHGA
jgi:type 1 glutamine amidotransferase